MVLTSIIHPTENAENIFEYFKYTYLESDEEEIGKAVGRWGVIQVYNKEYGGSVNAG